MGNDIVGSRPNFIDTYIMINHIFDILSYDNNMCNSDIRMYSISVEEYNKLNEVII
jgi:hypothetical protein